MFRLGFAVFAVERFPTGCHGLQRRGSVKAPSSVVDHGNYSTRCRAARAAAGGSRTPREAHDQPFGCGRASVVENVFAPKGLRPEEEWARQNAALGVVVEQHDDNTGASMYDLTIRYQDAPAGAVEVVAASESFIAARSAIA
jgi:hypothetical protein